MHTFRLTASAVFLLLISCCLPVGAQSETFPGGLALRRDFADSGAEGIQVYYVIEVADLSGWPPKPFPPVMQVDYAFTRHGSADPPVTGTVDLSGGRQRVLSFPLTYSEAAGEKFQFVLSNPVGLGESAPFLPLPFTPRTFTCTGGKVDEASAGADPLQFTVALDKPIAEDITFFCITSGGTATAGVDYLPAGGTHTIPAGSLSTTVHVTVKHDTLLEPEETVGLELADISVPVTRGTDTLGIIVDSTGLTGPVPAATLVTESPAVPQARAWFSVTLPAARATPVNCRIATRDGSARAGTDYQPLDASPVVFAPGETHKWISVIVTSGTEAESREDFFLDVEDLATRRVQSAVCAIEPFAITSIEPAAVAGNVDIRFPAGTGQRYFLERSATVSGPWLPASSLVTGTGAPWVERVPVSGPCGFLRLSTYPSVETEPPAPVR